MEPDNVQILRAAKQEISISEQLSRHEMQYLGSIQLQTRIQEMTESMVLKLHGYIASGAPRVETFLAVWKVPRRRIDLLWLFLGIERWVQWKPEQYTETRTIPTRVCPHLPCNQPGDVIQHYAFLNPEPR